MRPKINLIWIFLMALAVKSYAQQDNLKATKLLTIVIFLSILTFRAGAQYSKLTDVIPPGPEAQALMLLTDAPVNMYDGRPEISIPLYSFEVDGVAVPISISYNASGIKVNQEATFIGLGWSLIAGGQISREIRGQEDFSIISQYFNPLSGYSLDKGEADFGDFNYSYDEPFPGYSSAQMENFSNNVDDWYDMQPDIFKGSFLSHSLKFLFEQETANPFFFGKINDSYKLNFIDENNKNLGFNIKDSKGVNYTFEPSGWSDYHDPEGPITQGTTTWSLTNITTANNRQISFEYENDGAFSTPTKSFFSRKFQFDPTTYTSLSYPSALAVGDHYEYELNDFSSFSSDESLISKITFDAGEITFYASGREDNAGQKLDSIVVYNNHQEIIKTIKFYYTYFISSVPSGEKRLRLDEIKIDDEPEYEFTYNSLALPLKSSNTYDHWGYYNGKNATNNDPMPETKAGNETIGSSDRNPDENYAIAAVLEQIKYPTGGYVTYDYELNRFRRGYYENGVTDKQIDLDYNETIETTINIDEGYKKDVITIDYSIDATGTYGFSGSQLWSTLAAAYECLENPDLQCEPWGLYVQDTTNVDWNDVEQEMQNIAYVIVEELYPDYSFLENFQTKKIYLYDEEGTIPIELPDARNYKITVKSTPTAKVHIGLNYNKDLEGGGLRVKSTEIYDPTSGNTIKKEYTYGEKNEQGEEQRSYGRLICPISYAFRHAFSLRVHCCEQNEAVYLTDFSSNSYYLNSSGFLVGYDTVMVKNISGADIGYENYYFKNNESSPFPLGKHLPVDPFLDNGLQLGKDVFDSNQNLVFSIRNGYSEKTLNTYFGIIPVFLDVWYPCDCVGAIPSFLQDSKFGLCPQINKGSWIVLSSDTTYNFASDGSGNFVKTTKSYHYDNAVHKLLTRQITENSKGDIIESKFIYPPDIGNGVYASMTDSNMLNYPIEQITKLDGDWIDGKLTTYKTDDGNYVPNEIYSAEATTPLTSFTTYNGSTMDSNYGDTPVAEFLDYDAQGNIIKTKDRGGLYTYYLWAYDDQYPVAKIISGNSGISISSLQTSVDNITFTNSDILSNIQQDVNALNTALTSVINNNDNQVFYYTYQPLVGMTSQTDPAGRTTYYEYDDFGRLKLVRDQNDNIVSKSEYHYAE